jgi:hypothetical protein
LLRGLRNVVFAVSRLHRGVSQYLAKFLAVLLKINAGVRRHHHDGIVILHGFINAEADQAQGCGRSAAEVGMTTAGYCHRRTIDMGAPAARHEAGLMATATAASRDAGDSRRSRARRKIGRPGHRRPRSRSLSRDILPGACKTINLCRRSTKRRQLSETLHAGLRLVDLGAQFSNLAQDPEKRRARLVNYSKYCTDFHRANHCRISVVLLPLAKAISCRRKMTISVNLSASRAASSGSTPCASMH